MLSGSAALVKAQRGQPLKQRFESDMRLDPDEVGVDAGVPAGAEAQQPAGLPRDVKPISVGEVRLVTIRKAMLSCTIAMLSLLV